MLRFILVMVPLVFVINGLTKGDWAEAFFFAMAVAVGLTPEMLPMIVAVCLSKGALAMSRKKVIVKRINAIQNLGAMDVLCTDKTGTLTMDRVILERHCDVVLKEDDGRARAGVHEQPLPDRPEERAWTGRSSRTPRRTTHADDPRVRQGGRNPLRLSAPDHVGRRPHARRQGPHHQQGGSRGDLPALQRVSNWTASSTRWTTLIIDELKEEYEQLSADGFRVLAIASKDVVPRGVVAGDATPYSKADECDLILNGYVAFLDPPKETATAAIKALQGHGVAVKVLTGDNELVARKICKEVGLSTEFVLLGSEVERHDRRRNWPTAAGEDDAVRPRLPRPQAAHHQGPAIRASTPSGSWATASTTPRPSAPPTWASASIRPWTSPRSRPT